MLLTCPNCRNSYVVDDQLYAQQGGALCEQCQQPLVPSGNAGYGQQNAQWGQWGQQSQNVQWGQQPQSGQWGQPQSGQWGQQSQNVQWSQPQSGQWSQWGQGDIQWGQQPPGMPSSIAPVLDAQWGQQPQGNNQWGDQSQWSKMADKPEPEGAQPPSGKKQPDSIRTVALDLDDDWQDAINQASQGMPQGEPEPIQNPQETNDDDGWGALGSEWGSNQKTEPPPKPATPPTKASAGSLVIGNPLAKSGNNDVTRQVDIHEIQKIYGDQINPVKAFFAEIPMKYLIIIGASFGGFIILFIVLAIILSRPPEVETVITKRGEIVEAGTEIPKTFQDFVDEIKDLSVYFPALDGKEMTEGTIVAVDHEKGIFYHGKDKHIADISDISSGPAFVDKLYDVVSADMENPGQPIIFLFDETMPMSQVYRVMYSFAPSGRKLLFGGTTPKGISAIRITPCAWPDHGMFAFGDCAKSSIDVTITAKTVTMTRTKGDEPLSVDPDETTHTELQDNIIGDKVQFTNIAPALARFRSNGTGFVRVVPEGDIQYGVFINTVTSLYGSRDNPNTKEIYLAPVPLM